MTSLFPPLSRSEALELAAKLDTWPAGLGYVIERASNARGWRRTKYRPFGPPTQTECDDIKYCPVVQLHELRRNSRQERNYYATHLASWRCIRDAVAVVKNISVDDAHQLYNHLLKTKPRELADILRRYAGGESGEQVCKGASQLEAPTQ